jgi:hypothetical protein
MRVQQGLDHLPPISIGQEDPDEASGSYPRLTVHHFIEYNKSGEARIGLSRLVDIGIETDRDARRAYGLS